MERSKTKIASVEFLEDYKMDIYLSNGHQIVFHMKTKINTMRFSEIFTLGKFQTGTLVNGQIIRWDDNIELTLDEILYHISG